MYNYIVRISIGHVNEYPTMHYFGNPRHAQSMIAYMILISGNSSEKLNCGNVANMPYLLFDQMNVVLSISLEMTQ